MFTPHSPKFFWKKKFERGLFKKKGGWAGKTFKKGTKPAEMKNR
jgi:hypothetical protein